MKKKEIVIREMILSTANRQRITQLELSRRIGVSLSTVNNAISPLARFGAVEVRRTGLTLLDLHKAIVYLASVRNLSSDIVFSTRVDARVSEIEKAMPAGILYTAFTGYKFLYDEVPADYSEVYVYADEKLLEEIAERFPRRKGPPNLFVLKADESLLRLSKNSIVPPVQLFIDLWNLKEWYAKEFVNALSKRLKLE